MSTLTHKNTANGTVKLHYVTANAEENPTGRTILLCHGFPHFWYTWHRQIQPLVDSGWNVIIPDMRGAGQSDVPENAEDYSPHHIVSDLETILDAESVDKVVVSGFDFGAGAAYDLCHLRPERVHAVIGMENPFMGTGGKISPIQGAAMMAEKHFLHLHYFQEKGVADADLNAQCRSFLEKVFYALSADYHYLDVWQHPPGTTYVDALPDAPALPWSWLSVEEMDEYEKQWSSTGFTGGLMWYRAMDVSWHARKKFERSTNPVPFYFIYSDHDPDLEGFHGRDPLQKLGRYHDDVRLVRSVDRAGHLMHLEATEQCNKELLHCLDDIVTTIIA